MNTDPFYPLNQEIARKRFAENYNKQREAENNDPLITSLKDLENGIIEAAFNKYVQKAGPLSNEDMRVVVPILSRYYFIKRSEHADKVAHLDELAQRVHQKIMEN